MNLNAALQVLADKRDTYLRSHDLIKIFEESCNHFANLYYILHM